jgi:hypothetical protein
MNSNILMLLCIIIRCGLGVFGDLYAWLLAIVIFNTR